MDSNKILVVNDIPGFGKVAGNVNIPVLTSMGYQVAILTTLLLSENVSAPGDVYFHPIGDYFQNTIQHWRSTDITFQGVMTGFFNDQQQIEDLREYYHFLNRNEKHIPLIVDPIMADHGKFYPGFDEEFAMSMYRLIEHATLVTPNLTEACFLAETPYSDYKTKEELTDIADKILQSGVEYVLITGIQFEGSPDKIGFYLASRNDHQLIFHRYYPYAIMGTGDFAVSYITGHYLAHQKMNQAVEQCSHYLEVIMEETFKDESNIPKDRVIALRFEPLLHTLFKSIH